MVPGEKKEEVLSNLVDDIMENHNAHLNTGNQCTKYMMEALTELGRGDVAYSIATQTTYPGWGYMIEKGATTIWERWEYFTGPGMNSHDHPMHGSVGAWFYKYFAGIRVDPENPGWGSILIRPYPLGDLTCVEGKVRTVRGSIVSKWERKDNTFNLQVMIPVNSQARVSVPTLGWDKVRIEEGGRGVWENGSYIEGAEGISEGYKEKGYITFQVGSGTYSFEVQKKE